MCSYCNSRVIKDIVKQYQTSTYKLNKASCMEQIAELAINTELYWDSEGEPFETWYLFANGDNVRFYHDDETLDIVTKNKYFNYCPVCGRKLDSEE